MCAFAQYDGGDFGERMLYQGPNEPNHARKFIKTLTPQFKCTLTDKPKYLFRAVSATTLQVIICCPEHSQVCVARLLEDL